MPTQPVACIYYFQGDGHSVERWIKSAEEYFRFMNMPENEQVPYASNYLSYNVRACLGCLTCAVERISGRSWEWDWSRLKVALRGIRRQITSNKPSGNGGSWLKAFTLGAAVAVAGPAALGWAFAESAVCALGVVALIKMDTTDVKARAVASEVGRSELSPVAQETIRQVRSKKPSKSWNDGLKFNPSLELVIEMLKTMGPGKNAG